MNILMECAEDEMVFFDLFATTYEPRLPESPDLPMFMFPYQREAIARIIKAENDRTDLLIEKTRDMGMTWVLIWHMIHHWLFRDQWYGILGSRKEDEVDNKAPQSLFGKMRYGLYALPPWVRPQKFRKSDCDLHMKLVNPDRMSYMEGESANENFARGKRSAMIFMDELFFWKYAKESWRSATDSSPTRIGVSTPAPTSFARNLRNSLEEQGNLLTLDWRMHPFKDEEWFKKEELRRSSDPLATAGELELSYVSDPTLAYYPEASRCPTRDLNYNPDLPLYLGLDFGSQDKTAVTYWQRDTQNFYCLDGMEKRQKPLHWYYPFIKQGYDFMNADEYQIQNKFTKETVTVRKTDYLQVELDLIRRYNTWKSPVMYCGEAAHKQRMIKSNTSIQQELAAMGVPLRINDMAIAHSVRRTATKKMLNTTVFSSRNGALDVFDALVNSQFVSGRFNSGSDASKDKPVHDEYADIRSAVENFAVNVITEHSKVKVYQYRK